MDSFTFSEVELQMGRIRVALEERLRSPELSVDEAVNSRGPHGPGWEFPVLIAGDLLRESTPKKCRTKFRFRNYLND